jgi:hypothetical protein
LMVRRPSPRSWRVKSKECPLSLPRPSHDLPRAKIPNRSVCLLTIS